jgi:hypothetical protein
VQERYHGLRDSFLEESENRIHVAVEPALSASWRKADSSCHRWYQLGFDLHDGWLIAPTFGTNPANFLGAVSG